MCGSAPMAAQGAPDHRCIKIQASCSPRRSASQRLVSSACSQDARRTHGDSIDRCVPTFDNIPHHGENPCTPFGVSGAGSRGSIAPLSP